MRHIVSSLLIACALLGACAGSPEARRADEAAVIDAALASTFEDLFEADSLAVPSTGAERIATGYSFVAGQRLRYRRTYVHSSNDALYGEVAEAIVDVESVDADGTATLLLSTVSEQPWVHREVRGDPRVTSHRANAEPKVRVTMTRDGRIIRGEIAEASQRWLEAKERARRDPQHAFVISDSAVAALTVGQWFPRLAVSPEARSGAAVVDTLRRTQRFRSFNLDTLLPAPVPGGPAQRGVASTGVTRTTEVVQVRTYSMLPPIENDGERLRRIAIAEQGTQPLATDLVHTWELTTKMLLRGGAPVWFESESTSPNGWRSVTSVELIEE